MSGEPEIRPFTAAWRAALYAILGIVCLLFSLDGRRPWTGIGVLFALTWTFQVYLTGRPWGELGLTPGLAGAREWIAGAAVGGGLFALVAGALRATGALRLRPVHGPGPGRELWIVLAVFALIEEMMFRGYPFRTLALGFGRRPALAATSVLFAAAHMANPGAGMLGGLGTLAAGLLLGGICLRWRSLWAAWGLHFAWNAVQFLVLGFPMSGLTPAALGGSTVWAATLRGPAWWTGGAFGPEGGVPAVLILAASAWAVLRTVDPPETSEPGAPPA